MSAANRATLRAEVTALLATADGVIAAASADAYASPAAFEAAANEVREQIADLVPRLAAEWGVDSTTLVRALRTLAARLLDLRAAVSDELATLTIVVPRATSLAQLAARRYGDVSRWAELAALNPHIRHPGFIAAGTEVTLYVL